MMRSLPAAVCFLLLLTPKTFCQKTDDLFLKEATELKSVFKDSEIAELNSSVVYEYFIDPYFGLRVRKKQTTQYVSLKSNAKLTLRNYFNDHVKIESYSLKSTKGKKLQYDEYCGHTEKDGVFYSDGQICLYHSLLPLVGQGADYESSALYTDPRYLTQAFFNDYFPARKREIIFKIPDGVVVDLIEMNFNGYNIERKVNKERNFTIYTYSLPMAEAYSEDSNLPGLLHYAPHLLVLCKSYKAANGDEKTILSTTDDLYKWYSSLTAKLDTNYQTFRPLVRELTQNLKSDEAKMKVIYYWVQDNIKYLAFEDGIAAFKPDDAKNVFYKRYGDCKGMANLTKAMMKVAGLDARLTWIGTDKIPYPYSLPTLAVDNHMICTVFSDGKKYILDATEKGNPMGEFAERIQGKEILIEDGTKYQIEKVPGEPMDYYLEESIWKFKLTNKQLEGKGEPMVKGERKKEILYFLGVLKTTDRDKFLEKFVAGNADYKQFQILNRPSLSRDSLLSISSEAKLENQVYSNLKELYIDMDFDEMYKDGQLKKDRKTPYKFDSRVFKKLRTELIIPPEYIVSYLPDPLHIKNNFYEFDLSYQSIDNKLVYKKEIRILKNTLPPSEIVTWNKTVQEVKNFYNNQVILKEK